MTNALCFAAGGCFVLVFKHATSGQGERALAALGLGIVFLLASLW